MTKIFQLLDRDQNLLQRLLNDRPTRATTHQDNGDNTPPPETAPPTNCADPNADYWERRCLAAESQLRKHNIPLPATSLTPTTPVTPLPWTGTPAAQKLFPGQMMNRVKLTPKTRNATMKPYPRPQEIIVPCADPKAVTDSMKAQVGMAINAALRNAKAPTNVAIVTVRKIMSGNLMLKPSPHTSAQELLPHLDLIHEAARTVNPSLLPPRLNEKWYKLAVHGIPTDHYPDTEEGMQRLQEDIEQSNGPLTLAQPPHYMSHPDKRAGRTASSVVIAVRTQEELNKLKRNKVTVLFEPRKVTDYFTARSIDQCRRCQQLGHHQATCRNNSGPICSFCAGNHPTEKHQCPECPNRLGKSCPHTAHKCSNCTAAGNTDTEHVAFNPRCPIKNQAIRDTWQKTRAERETDNTTDESNAMNTNE
jgi:hypothetical protein